MLLNRFSAVFVAALVVGGCVTSKIDVAFDPAAAAYIHANGSASVSGQAFMRRNDGVVVYAAGSDVIIVPSTPYIDERTAKYFKGQKYAFLGTTFENEDPRYVQYRRVTRADGEGRFVFDKLAAGKYYIATTVTWMAGNYRQGGALLETVTVKDGESASIIMTGT